VRIEVHIDRLLVDGVPGLDGRHARALQAAVVAELTRVLATRSGWTPRAARTLTAGPLALPEPVVPATAGHVIAEGLWTALTAARARR
jgi:hypothetical protein